MNDVVTLSDIELNCICTVDKIKCDGMIRHRLMDIGIIPGAKIECVLESSSGNPRGYFVKGSLFAIRNEDADLIEVLL